MKDITLLIELLKEVESLKEETEKKLDELYARENKTHEEFHEYSKTLGEYKAYNKVTRMISEIRIREVRK